MTYCVALRLDSGMIFASDSRTNAGVDHIATFTKMRVYEKKDERVICPGRQVIVDLGCGPGAVTELILERVRDQQPPPRVIGVDPSPSALAKARASDSDSSARSPRRTRGVLE